MARGISSWNCPYCGFEGNLATDQSCFVCHRERDLERVTTVAETPVEPSPAQAELGPADTSHSAAQSSGPLPEAPQRNVAEQPYSTTEAPDEDLLGQRIGAAVVDIALLTALFVLVGVTIGSPRRGLSGFAIYLEGTSLLVYVGLVVLYYIVLEAILGQSVGKILLGLRVVRPDGSRARFGAIIVRNLIRLVDWLPAFYLVGFISVMVSGARRQRLGDLAAKTVIRRAVPARFRLAAAAGSVIFVVFVGFVVVSWAAGGSVGCATQGVSYEVPVGWQAMDPATVQSQGNPLCTEIVGVEGETDAVIQVYRLPFAVTDANRSGLVSEMQGLLTSRGAVIEGGPEEVTMGGMPAVRIRISFGEGNAYGATGVAAFEGTTEYWLYCEWTPTRAAEAEQACDQIRASFRVD